MSNPKSTVISPDLMRMLVAQFRLDSRSVHGAAHWMRVRRNGLLLAELTGANATVVELFAVFHDSCRLSDYNDPDHGSRGADLAEKYYYHHNLLNCSQRELETLTEACRGHTDTHTHHNITVATCWDADRLDLPRCGITVDPLRLATEQAKKPIIIDEAMHHAIGWLERQTASSIYIDCDDWELSKPRLRLSK